MSETISSACVSPVSGLEDSLSPKDSSDYEEVTLDAPKYMTDEFRMNHFKIDKCPKLHAHDWTTCPLAHAGEKARRRDPAQFKYAAIACIDMKNNGSCPRGDDCPYAHNVFEYWMHPTRYRTQICNDGTKCKRQICFFAHRLEELRIPPRKPGFPPEWNKGRKNKNRNISSKKKSTSKIEVGYKGDSEPVAAYQTILHDSAGMRNTADISQSVSPRDQGKIQKTNAMRNVVSEKQHGAVDCQPISSVAEGLNYPIQYQYIADQQCSAVQSETQTSRGLDHYGLNLERALRCTVAGLGLDRTQEYTPRVDGYVSGLSGDVFGLNRMNPDLMLSPSNRYDALSTSFLSGSTLGSPQSSQIRSPQKLAPFPGMGSDIESPAAPILTEFCPLKLENTYHPYQHLFRSDHQQPFAC